MPAGWFPASRGADRRGRAQPSAGDLPANRALPAVWSSDATLAWADVRRFWQVGLILPFACACGMAQAQQVRAEPEQDDPAAVYDVSLPIDGAVIVVSAAGILVPYALSSHFIHPTCPCSPSSVNSFDRGVIGNASDTAGPGSAT